MALYVDSPIGTPVAFTVESDDLDLTQVTSAVLAVQRSDQSEAEWPCTLASSSATELTVTHALETGDLTRPGAYRLYAIVTYPGGTRRSDAVVVAVKSKFQLH